MAASKKRTKPVFQTEFHLKVVLGNDSLYTGEQVADLLRKAALDLQERNPQDLGPPELTEDGRSGGRSTGNLPLVRALRDVNGNVVGQYLVAEVEQD